MAEPDIASDPNAWLYSYFARLKNTSAFARLAPSHQVKALADAIEPDNPAGAVETREWNAATATAMLLWLGTATAARPERRQVEVWRMRKGTREARCVDVYSPPGSTCA